MDAGGRCRDAQVVIEVLSGGGPNDCMPGESEPGVKAGKPLYRGDFCLICCGVGIAIQLTIVLLIAILVFTVLRVRNPTITVNGMRVDKFELNRNLLALDVTLDVDLHMSVTVSNPNWADFDYSNSTTDLYYHGQLVGSGAVPSGGFGAHKTLHIETDFNIANLVLKDNTNLTSDMQQGILPISTVNKTKGRLNVINIFIQHAISISACDVNIWIGNATLKNFTCASTVKILL